MSKKLPQVGDGATAFYYSDRHAHTVVAVSKTGKVVTTQRDTATRIDDRGQCATQTWEFVRNPTAPMERWYLNARGVYQQKGGSPYLGVGQRREYFDYGY